jgi:hypothetical protein
MQAAERLLDRIYGRPKQVQEHSGPDGGPIDVSGSVDLTKVTEDELDVLEEIARRVAKR